LIAVVTYFAVNNLEDEVYFLFRNTMYKQVKRGKYIWKAARKALSIQAVRL